MPEVLTENRVAPNKVTPTTVPNNTFIKVPHVLPDEGVLVYRPDDNSFIALYLEEWHECRAEGHENNKAIEELQEANRNVTEKSLAVQELLRHPNSSKADIDNAKKELEKALNELAEKSEAAKKRVEAIVDQKTDEKKLVEIVPLTMKRVEGKPMKTPIYIKADKLKSALADKRVYMVEGEAERKKAPKDKLFNGTSLNAKEVHNRIADKVQDKAKFSKKWKLAPKDADAYSGVLTEWAKVMGADATHFLERKQEEIVKGIFPGINMDPKDPHRMIDMKPEAQFMRWSAGAGAEANFMPMQGNFFDKRDKDWGSRFKRAAKAAQFGIKANADASFAIGEAKVDTAIYLPHSAGWELSPAVIGQNFNFGYFRLRGDLSLYAMAGASITIEADASLLITGDKQGVKGTPKGEKGAKAKVGAKAEAKVFAGLKEGVKLAGAVQWLNPEGFIDPAKPKKADPSKAIAEYADVASVDCGVEAIEGLAASLGFECKFKDGNFVIAAKAGACLGLGGSGNVAGKVGAAQIAQFFMCIAHQLKQADYRKMAGLMEQETFDAFNQIMYLVVVQRQKLEDYVGVELDSIRTLYLRAKERILQKGDQFIHEIDQQLKSGWGWFAYMPPESRGTLIKDIIDVVGQTRYASNYDLRLMAAASVNELVRTTQSNGHLDNTLDRISLAMGDVSGRSNGIQQIKALVDGTPFANCIDAAQTQLASAHPLIGRPFMRNDEPDFMRAQFPLHHKGYEIV